MDSGEQVNDYTERQRELVARDLHDLGDKLDVKKQTANVKAGVADAAHNKLDSIKEKIPMYQSSNPVVRTLTHHPLAAAAFLWGGTHLLRAAQPQGSPGMRARVHDLRDAASSGLDSVQSGAKSAIGSVQDAASSAVDSVQGAASGAASGVQDAGSGVADRASQIADSAREVLPTDRQQLQQAASSNWSILGAGAFALGGLIGYLTPNTSFEDKKLAPVREDLVDTAKDKIGEVKEAATATAQEAASTLKDTVQEATGTVTESVQEVAQEAKEGFQDKLSDSDATSGDADAASSEPQAAASSSSL